MSNEGIMLTMFFGMTLAALLFGNRYLKNKERMFMIEKGFPADKEGNEFLTSLKVSLLLIGCGLGLFISFLLAINVFVDLQHLEIVYFSLMALLGGVGLLIAYAIEKPNIKDKP